jgi:hypothetical protein
MAYSNANRKMNSKSGYRQRQLEPEDGSKQLYGGYRQLELEPEDESKQPYGGYGLRQRQEEDEFEECLAPTATGTGRRIEATVQRS